MAEIILRVTPAELRNKAEAFRSVVADIQKRFAAIQDISLKTRGYWIGEAGDKDREGFVSYQDDIAYIIGRLNEHPTDLLNMAGIYEETEAAIREINSELQTDMIV